MRQIPESREVQRQRIYEVVASFCDFYQKCYAPEFAKNFIEELQKDDVIGGLLKEGEEKDFVDLIEMACRTSGERVVGGLKDTLKRALTGING